MTWTKQMKRSANQAVHLEVRAGIRPHANAIPCSECGHIRTDEDHRRHEWHHHLGYDREHWFSVVVLCTTCHGRHSAHAQQTHCKYGHEFTPENTITRKGRRGRFCRTCAHLRGVKQAKDRKAERHARGLRKPWDTRRVKRNG